VRVFGAGLGVGRLVGDVAVAVALPWPPVAAGAADTVRLALGDALTNVEDAVGAGLPLAALGLDPMGESRTVFGRWLRTTRTVATASVAAAAATIPITIAGVRRLRASSGAWRGRTSVGSSLAMGGTTSGRPPV
jgi:hypothetical protein